MRMKKASSLIPVRNEQWMQIIPSWRLEGVEAVDHGQRAVILAPSFDHSLLNVCESDHRFASVAIRSPRGGQDRRQLHVRIVRSESCRSQFLLPLRATGLSLVATDHLTSPARPEGQMGKSIPPTGADQGCQEVLAVPLRGDPSTSGLWAVCRALHVN